MLLLRNRHEHIHYIQLMKTDEYITEFPEYLKGVRDSADNTVKDYLHDVNRYFDYFRSQIDPSLETFKIDAFHIRGFVMFLRSAGNENSTIERRLHGLYTFWGFLHDQHDYPAPVSLRMCNVRLKKKRNPTQPLMQKNYISLMKRLKNEISRIR